jgi:manganese/zinc/iron transport system permease protein
MFDDFFLISFVPILTSLFSALSCTLVGNILVLRKQSMLSDTISHVALPGIVISFLIFENLGSYFMLVGAAVAGLAAAGTIAVLRSYTSMDNSAAMATTLSVFFAAGVLMIELTAGGNVHLDVEHALYGNLESLIWIDGESLMSVFDPAARQTIPVELSLAIIGFVLIASLMLVYWRFITISTFDQTFAEISGVPVVVVSAGLALAATIAAVISFDAVGSIIVVSMFVCPPAAALILTQSLRDQVGLSLLFSALSAVLGYVVAGYVPILLGFETSISAAGTIATLSGLILACAIFYRKHQRSYDFLDGHQT